MRAQHTALETARAGIRAQLEQGDADLVRAAATAGSEKPLTEAAEPTEVDVTLDSAGGNEICSGVSRSLGCVGVHHPMSSGRSEESPMGVVEQHINPLTEHTIPLTKLICDAAAGAGGV
eukprot:m.1031691 g.1031691  ORF g.1031691 m.1031691 type:complete len:119 (+) comp24123_c1_seq7:3193-3549(+)